MTYDWHPDKIIKTDSVEDWAGNCAYMADALIRTAQLALENDGSGACDDATRIASATNTLEVAMAMMAIVIDGTEGLQSQLGVGLYRKRQS